MQSIFVGGPHDVMDAIFVGGPHEGRRLFIEPTLRDCPINFGSVPPELDSFMHESYWPIHLNDRIQIRRHESLSEQRAIERFFKIHAGVDLRLVDNLKIMDSVELTDATRIGQRILRMTEEIRRRFLTVLSEHFIPSFQMHGLENAGDSTFFAQHFVIGSFRVATVAATSLESRYWVRSYIADCFLMPR